MMQILRILVMIYVFRVVSECLNIFELIEICNQIAAESCPDGQTGDWVNDFRGLRVDGHLDG
jgi:hypothetical protein